MYIVFLLVVCFFLRPWNAAVLIRQLRRESGWVSKSVASPLREIILDTSTLTLVSLTKNGKMTTIDKLTKLVLRWNIFFKKNSVLI